MSELGLNLIQFISNLYVGVLLGRPEEAAVEPGEGQSQTGQGVGLDGYSVGEGHCEDGQIMVNIDLYFNPSTI